VLIRREREDHNGERHPGWLRHTLVARGEIKEADQEAEQEADGHDASGVQGAHQPASTTDQAKGHAAD
jgi:hypothetical protein